ncbi:MAG: XdhC family protein [Candidatus Cyclobacteriaceae bacterium M3_2C_046]
MKELVKILKSYDEIDFERTKAALATVVQVEGSSYRRPGARMLMTEDGRWTGSISGGCLEGDALRKSRQVILAGKPRVVVYDTMDDESAEQMGIGLGCNGVIHVLLEPLHPSDPENPLEVLRLFLKNEKPCGFARVLDQEGSLPFQLGDRLFVQDDKYFLNQSLGELLGDHLKEAVTQQRSRTAWINFANGRLKIFFEVLNPPIHLIIFGGGFDAVPVVNLAKQLGWKVTVTDDCIAHVSPNRFPEADLVSCVARQEIENYFQFRINDAVLIMSHNFKYDLSVLSGILKQQENFNKLKYIGLLGPKKRAIKLFQQLEAQKIHLSPADLAKIYYPVGLDIGADDQEEIALAIISEIKAVYSQRKGGFLKNRKDHIHPRETEKAISIN